MYTSMKKISKDKDVEPTEFAQTVAQVIFYLNYMYIYNYTILVYIYIYRGMIL